MTMAPALVAGAFLSAVPLGDGHQPQHPGASNLILQATVVRVIDGDSIAVNLDSGPMQVRFHGIDAPEWKQPFGREAKAELGRLLGPGQKVELLPVDQDRYERMVAVVYAGGKTVNEGMIAGGFAWAYRKYLGQIAGDGHYCELEAQARAAHRGLWSQSTELWVPPWIYRQRARAGPGPKVPSREYSRETAADCIAEMKESRLASLPQ
jgi:micrococcal nuclease